MTEWREGEARAGEGVCVDRLTKTFGRHHALRGVCLEARPGRVTGFLGPNGSGKSTTLRCLLGLQRPDSGTATIEGVRYERHENPTSVVGAVLDSSTVDPAMSGYAHLKVYAAFGGHRAERVDRCVEELEMGSYAHRCAGGYSTGMRQRLGIATALLGNPRIVVLDEPTNGLDPDGIAWVRELVRDFAASGRTVLVSTHVLSEFEGVLDDVVIVREGRTLVAGAVERLKEDLGVDSLEAVYAKAGGRR